MIVFVESYTPTKTAVRYLTRYHCAAIAIDWGVTPVFAGVEIASPEDARIRDGVLVQIGEEDEPRRSALVAAIAERAGDAVPLVICASPLTLWETLDVRADRCVTLPEEETAPPYPRRDDRVPLSSRPNLLLQRRSLVETIVMLLSSCRVQEEENAKS